MKKQKKLNIKVRAGSVEERHGWWQAPASQDCKPGRARRVDMEPYRCRKMGLLDGQR